MADVLFQVNAVQAAPVATAVMFRDPLSFSVAANLKLPVPAPLALQPLASLNVVGTAKTVGVVSAALSPMDMRVSAGLPIGASTSFVFAPRGFQVTASEVLAASVTLTRTVRFDVVAGLSTAADVRAGLTISFAVNAPEVLTAFPIDARAPMAFHVEGAMVIPATVSMSLIASRDISAGQTLLLEATEDGGTLSAMVDRWRMLLDADAATIEITGDAYPLED